MTDQTDPTGKTFEARIRGLLELLGYRAQHDRLVAGRQTDLVAVKDVFPGRMLYLVECKDYSQRVGVDVITNVEVRLKAAQGMDGRQYPWGDGFDPDKCNTRESGVEKTMPVGKYSPQGDSPYGVADMTGNVWEWWADWYDEDRDTKLLRGGSWYYYLRYARCSCRFWSTPHLRGDYGGFRVSRGSSSANC